MRLKLRMDRRLCNRVVPTRRAGRRTSAIHGCVSQAHGLANPAGSTADRADLRCGHPWAPAQRLKNDLLWALASTALGATRPISVAGLRVLGRALGLAAYRLAGSARRCANANVARVFVDTSDADRTRFVRRCFARLGELMGETVALLRPETTLPPLVLVPEAREALQCARATARGAQGVLFASAHLGPWERVAASIVSSGVPLIAVARESYDPRFSALFERIRSRAGVRVIWRGRPGAAAGIIRVLRGGGVLGIPMDLRSRVASRLVPFLGIPAPTAIGPARLALMTGAAVVVGSVAPGSDGSLVVTATPIPTGDLRPGEEGAFELTLRINAELSRRILALPDAWVWMHERWPEGASMMNAGGPLDRGTGNASSRKATRRAHREEASLVGSENVGRPRN
jgi:KDO2-lipid IV(A) lauroyltransferase